MKAARRAADDDLQAIASQVQLYRVNKGLPASLADVLAAPRPDPWGNAYVLEARGEGLAVRSYGPDGKANTTDDLVRPVASP